MIGGGQNPECGAPLVDLKTPLGGSQSSDGEVLLGVHEEATVGTIRGGLSHNDGVDLVKGVDAWTVSEGSVKKTSYSEAVRDDLSETLQPDFVVKNGVADVSIPEELMEDVDPLWKYFVVGYFMNDVPHIGSIHSTVKRIWSSPGKVSKIDVQFIRKRIVLFRVEDAQVRSRIIIRKFWHISEVPLVLNEWTAESKAPPDLSAMPLWVDLYHSNYPKD